jgi:hypothetical protein
MELINIDGVNIPFNNEWDNIAIALSGGADSALLTYLLCNIIAERKLDIHIHCISHVRMWKSRPWQEIDSLRVFQNIHQRFDISMTRYTNFIAPDLEYGNIGPTIKDEYNKMVSGDNIQQRAYSEYICHKQNVKCFYNAVTRNPSIKLDGAMVERDIDKNENNKHMELMEHMGIIASHPFRFTDKAWVLKQYHKHNIMDLFETTRSCEGEFNNIDYQTYKPNQYVPTCNKCFWCLERDWAIEQSK